MVREATVQGRMSQRIGELDAEWDIERAIEMNASALHLWAPLWAISHIRTGSRCRAW